MKKIIIETAIQGLVKYASNERNLLLEIVKKNPMAIVKARQIRRNSTATGKYKNPTATALEAILDCHCDELLTSVVAYFPSAVVNAMCRLDPSLIISDHIKLISDNGRRITMHEIETIQKNGGTQKIPLIKEYRQLFGTCLQDSKFAIEELRAKNLIQYNDGI
jgi:hypothetical protein